MIQVRNPRTGKMDYTFQPIAPAALNIQLQRMREAQIFWQHQPVEYRIGALQQWKNALNRHKNDLIKAICTDTGRHAETILEVDFVINSIDKWCLIALEQAHISERKHTSSPTIQTDGMNVPYALVAVITPWQFPLLLSFIDTIPALLSGCAVVVKPSEITPRFIQIVEKTLNEVSALRGILRFVEGAGETGAQLVQNADLVCFTGSIATGRKVYQAAAQQFIPVFLELSGNDAAIVLNSADIDKAAAAISWGALLNAGQSCLSIERIYVQENVIDSFIDKLTQRVNRLRLNYPNIQEGQIGPIISEKQVEIIDAQLRDAVKRGATIVTGSEKCQNTGGGSYCRPTVLKGVNHTMQVMNDETSGPIMPVMGFKTVEEAIALANDCKYGLSASVFAGTNEEAMLVAQHLSVGAVSINDAALTSIIHDVEKNAFKMSGLGGTRMGAGALRRFTRRKAFLIKQDTNASAWWFK
jgi:succinate-semialdehyde dehydrogenase / glutarate-semialdehyde dehydrogenase